MKIRKIKTQGKHRILTWRQCGTNVQLLLHATCGYKFHHACSKLLWVAVLTSKSTVVLQGIATVKTQPLFFSFSAQNLPIILISFQCLFFSKFCQQNLSRPNKGPLWYIHSDIGHLNCETVEILHIYVHNTFMGILFCSQITIVWKQNSVC